MGANATKIEEQNILAKVFDPQIDFATFDSENWEALWSISYTSDDIFIAVTVETIRKLKNEKPEHLSTVLYQVDSLISKTFQIVLKKTIELLKIRLYLF